MPDVILKLFTTDGEQAAINGLQGLKSSIDAVRGAAGQITPNIQAASIGLNNMNTAAQRSGESIRLVGAISRSAGLPIQELEGITQALTMSFKSMGATGALSWGMILGPIAAVILAYQGIVNIIDKIRIADEKRAEAAKKAADEDAKLAKQLEESYLHRLQLSKPAEAEKEEPRLKAQNARDAAQKEFKATVIGEDRVDWHRAIFGYSSAENLAAIAKTNEDAKKKLIAKLQDIDKTYQAETTAVNAKQAEEQGQMVEDVRDEAMKAYADDTRAYAKKTAEKEKLDKEFLIKIQDNIREYNQAAIDEDAKAKKQTKVDDDAIEAGKRAKLQNDVLLEDKANAGRDKGFQAQFVSLEGLGRRIQQAAASREPEELKTIAAQALKDFDLQKKMKENSDAILTGIQTIANREYIAVIGVR